MGKQTKGVQCYRCPTCKKTFAQTKETMFYRCHHSEEEIVECMAMVGDRNSLAAIHRIKGVKEETVCQVSVTTKVVYGDSEQVKKLLGEHTPYVERTNLTLRQMNGRLVRKTLSFSCQ